MTRHEIRRTAPYVGPPADRDEALERGQIMYEEPNILRKAADVPPANRSEALDVIGAAGSYPANLLDTKWNSVDEFADVLREMHWKVEIKPLDRFLHGARRTYIVAATSRDDKHSMEFIATDKGYLSNIDNVMVVKSTDKEWLKANREQ